MKTHVTSGLTYLVQKAEKSEKEISINIRIKLTGVVTRIAYGFSVVDIAFTMIEEGIITHSSLGDHIVEILKVSESYTV